MLDIDIIADEELQGVVSVLISGVLPHKNYHYENYAGVLGSILSYIKLEEFSMEYHVLLKALYEMNKIKITAEGFKPEMTKEIFSQIVSVSVEDLVTNPCIQIKRYLEYEGLSSNLSIQTARETAMQRLYTRSMDLYDKCFEMAFDSSKVENYLPAYRSAFIAHVGMQSVQAQNAIITGNLRIGKRVYAGFEDWLEYSTMMNGEIHRRLQDVDDASSLVTVNSLEIVDTMSRELRNSFIPIANWGIPELDGDGLEAGTPILRHRLVVVVGSVNIGKSMFCKDAATTVLLDNKKVLYMYGEGASANVWGDLLVNYIYKRFSKYVTVPMLTNEEEQPEEIRRIIRLAKAELYESGNLSLRKAYSYDTLHQELVDDYKQTAFDMVIIDHSLALETSGKTNQENVHNLAITARNFKREYPVCVLIASHPSAAAKDYLSSGRKIPSDIATTKESSTLEAEADELFVLRDTEILAKQGLIALENKKRRNAPRLTEQVILRKCFDVCHFEYNLEDQATDQRDVTSAEQALLDLENSYDDDYDYTL
ncbi:hypothetical protein D7Y41_02795 [Anaerotruncus sp. 1XD22-93]|nr:hypothetical protein [Lachnospiraceae bacterium]NBI74209.1 hypothetical protein [Lachnospiraceae bacterium]RKK00402.1 hypothetical protein D7Y41_02795 [Anaerotruncus sp. 1XD22-93]